MRRWPLAILILAGCASSSREAHETGRINREKAETTRVRWELRYSELTAKEKAIVHSWYEFIEPGDEPPYPSEGVEPVHEAIRQAQQKLLVSGKLFLIATVEPDGRVSQVEAVGSPSRKMVEVASQILMLTPFKAALCSGRPCRMDFPISYRFRVL